MPIQLGALCTITTLPDHGSRVKIAESMLHQCIRLFDALEIFAFPFWQILTIHFDWVLLEIK